MQVNAIALLTVLQQTTAFLTPNVSFRTQKSCIYGYLDDLSKELYSPSNDPDIEKTYDNLKMKEEDIDRHGPGNWDDYVDFDEFDGGDGQMGVAGDGDKGLEKIGRDSTPMVKSRIMSAKNSWGTSNGYAEDLVDKGVEQSRAQQFENWHNQREIHKKSLNMKYMADEFDKVNTDDNWRDLASFGAERNEDFDLDEAFGEVTAGDEIEGTIELTSRIGQARIHELEVLNDGIGYSDFRARFTPSTPSDWKVAPMEGSLHSKNPLGFVVRFSPSNPGTAQGHLVIETEDMKKTWLLIGGTA